MAKESKPKIFEGGKDMLLSLGVTVLAMLAVVGATGLCTINPETQQGPVQDVDEETFFEMESRAGDQVIRSPQMPEGWEANAARRAPLAGENSAVVSWLTPNDGFVESRQTQVPVDDAIEAFDPNYRPEESTREIAGHEVRILEADDPEIRPLWATDLGDARLLISGSASDDEYVAAIEAFIAADPLQPEA
ncbi:DUF4245 domain-containing protein [Corynebacterium camporealensis]|uniref:DUF4245 domain-containing protein n=1 Tax=Corynebacterium camporealensis TaxID=161896 RepID=UPI0034CFA39E